MSACGVRGILLSPSGMWRPIAAPLTPVHAVVQRVRNYRRDIRDCPVSASGGSIRWLVYIARDLESVSSRVKWVVP